MEILIVKTSSLGDVVHALPAVNSLVAAYPDAQIDFLVNPAFRDIVGYCRNLREVILFDRKRFGTFPGGFAYTFELISRLRKKHYDMVIDLQGLLRSAIFAGFASADRKIGFSTPREPLARWFYRERVAVKPGHAIERNLELIRRITGRDDAEFPPLPDNPAFAAAAAELLRTKQIDPLANPLIAVAPGARWRSKCFPPELFAAVMQDIAAAHPLVRFVLLGAAVEKPSAQQIAGSLPEACFDLTGETSIGAMTEILRSCRGLICNDSGPMHLAAALQIPVFALFGPTDPRRTGPYGANCRVLRREDLNCEGCLKRVCPRDANAAPCWALDHERIAREVAECL